MILNDMFSPRPCLRLGYVCGATSRTFEDDVVDLSLYIICPLCESAKFTSDVWGGVACSKQRLLKRMTQRKHFGIFACDEYMEEDICLF